MLIDIGLGIPLILFALLGMRDGIVRKLVAMIVFIISLFIGQSNMHKIGSFMVEEGWIGPQYASMLGFLVIFVVLAILQGLLYRVLTGGYKIGGAADRVGGIFFGFIEGVLFLSSILFIFAMAGIPSRESTNNSKLYKPIVNIAPQILDFTSTAGPEAVEKLKDIGTSGTVSGEKEKLPRKEAADSAAAAESKKQNDILNQARSTIRKLK
jgi:membrane protein required for colicin V production